MNRGRRAAPETVDRHRRTGGDPSPRSLILPAAGSLALYSALFLLIRTGVLRPDAVQGLGEWRFLETAARRLMPDTAGAAVGVYALLVAGLFASWLGALRLVRPGGCTPSLAWVVLPALLFGLVLLWLPGMFSKDLYLYSLYGRVISTYGENPILAAPRQFRPDPHLAWAPYTNLPSAYGPVWLLLSGALSGLAGETQAANVLAYRGAGLVLHLSVAASVWATLRRTRPELAAWGAVFYGWNPLALFETVGNGHNDVLVALFAVWSMLAAARRRWLVAVALLAAGAMVKATAALLLPLLLLAWLREIPGARARVRASVAAGAVAAATALALYAPLWGGAALYENIRGNPASRAYANSPWALLASRLAEPGDRAAAVAIRADLDLVRNALFAAAFALVAYRTWKGRELSAAWTWCWFAFCLSLAWIFPWYFVLPIALAAVRGPGRTAALAAALTLGGLLYWAGRPRLLHTEVAPLVQYRALLLLGPAVAAALWFALRESLAGATGRAAEREA